MEFIDYYKILGLDKSATSAEIKKAYRKLARQFHPDRNDGSQAAEAKFKEVQSAYDSIADAEARRKYEWLGAYVVEQWWLTARPGI